MRQLKYLCLENNFVEQQARLFDKIISQINPLNLLGDLKIALRGGGGGEGMTRTPAEGGGGGWRNGVPCRALCFV